MSLISLSPQIQSALIKAGINAGVLEAERVKQLEVIARRQQMALLDLVKFEWCMPLRVLYQLWAESLDLPFTTLAKVKPDHEVIAKLSPALIWRRGAVPVFAENGGAQQWVVCADPKDQSWVASYQKIQPIFQIAVAEPESIERFLTLHLPVKQLHSKQVEQVPVALLEHIFVECHLRRASDIHIESLKYGVRVRLRVDGKLQSYGSLFETKLGHGLISRVKVLAGMDIAESRAPQDGGFSYSFQQAPLDPVDVRVASLPGYHGERITIRILAAGAQSLTLEQLGMPEHQLARFKRLIRQSNGMLLITGPTGSGKSTTLYSALQVINSEEINVLTVEDPVESYIEGITQVNVNNKTRFSDALRSFLRHDPDVIMVGEIRDKDTADVALKASLTGHFVFSTLHTNTACGAITRLSDIGCDAFLVGATLRAVIAQRLVRRLCRYCRLADSANCHDSALLGIEPGTMIYRAKGCARCQGSGYSGRIGLFEILWINSALAEFIAQGPSELAMAERAGADLCTLRQDAADKVMAGWVDVADVEPLLGMLEVRHLTRED